MGVVAHKSSATVGTQNGCGWAAAARGRTQWNEHANCFARVLFVDADLPEIVLQVQINNPTISDRIKQHDGCDSSCALRIINERGENVR